MNATNASTPKTVEQLKEELRIAQEAVMRQECEAAEALREEREKRNAEEKVIQDKINTLLVPIYDALFAAGIIYIKKLNCGIKIGNGDYPDPDLQISVGREERASHGGFSVHTSYTGRYILTVGDRYRDFPRVRYPSLKAGGFNVAKIVTTVKERVEAKAAAAKREVEKQRAALSGEALAAELCKELGTDVIVGKYGVKDPWGHGKSSWREYVAPEGKVFIRLGTFTCTPEQARVLIQALAQVKAMEPKKGPA